METRSFTGPRGVRHYPKWHMLALLLLGTLVTVLSGCSPHFFVVRGSGEPATREFSFAEFTRVQLDDGFTATVTRGDSTHVEVTVDDNVLEYLRVTREGDTLHIGIDWPWPWNYWNTTQEAQITLPRLRGIEVRDGSDAAVEGFSSQGPLDLSVSDGASANFTGVRAGEVAITVSDAGRLSGQIEAQELRGQVSDGSNVSLEGSGSAADLGVSGASRLDLGAFSLRDADLRLSDVSRGIVRVSGTVNVRASDISRLDYFGSPRVREIDTSGGASVVRAGN